MFLFFPSLLHLMIVFFIIFFSCWIRFNFFQVIVPCLFFLSFSLPLSFIVINILLFSSPVSNNKDCKCHLIFVVLFLFGFLWFIISFFILFSSHHSEEFFIHFKVKTLPFFLPDKSIFHFFTFMIVFCFSFFFCFWFVTYRFGDNHNLSQVCLWWQQQQQIFSLVIFVFVMCVFFFFSLLVSSPPQRFKLTFRVYKESKSYNDNDLPSFT